MADSIFSKIISRQIPAQIVFEDEQVLAFRDIAPKAPVHILVIPKNPIANVGEATAADEPLLGHMLLVASQVARQENIDRTGYRLVINKGADAGESVPHLHIHVLGGRSLGWPPG
jgi:histidine triad (HIT) family protein